MSLAGGKGNTSRERPTRKSNVAGQPPAAGWFVVGYLVHVLDEWFTGAGFPAWLSGVTGGSFTARDFVMLNAIGMVVVTLAAVAASRGVIVARVALATVTGTNALLHLGASLFTRAVVPGVLSATLLWLPLAALTLGRVIPFAPRRGVLAGIAIGLAAHAAVTWVAIGRW